PRVGDVLRGRAPMAPFTQPIGTQGNDLLDHAEHRIADALGLRLELGEIDVLEPALPLDFLRGAFGNDTESCLHPSERRLDFQIVPRARLVREYPTHLWRGENVLKDRRVEGGCGHGMTPGDAGMNSNNTVAAPSADSLGFTEI